MILLMIPAIARMLPCMMKLFFLFSAISPTRNAELLQYGFLLLFHHSASFLIFMVIAHQMEHAVRGQKRQFAFLTVAVFGRLRDHFFQRDDHVSQDQLAALRMKQRGIIVQEGKITRDQAIEIGKKAVHEAGDEEVGDAWIDELKISAVLGVNGTVDGLYVREEPTWAVFFFAWDDTYGFWNQRASAYITEDGEVILAQLDLASNG